jgi:hypothetical protein
MIRPVAFCGTAWVDETSNAAMTVTVRSDRINLATNEESTRPMIDLGAA